MKTLWMRTVYDINLHINDLFFIFFLISFECMYTIVQYKFIYYMPFFKRPTYLSFYPIISTENSFSAQNESEFRRHLWKEIEYKCEWVPPKLRICTVYHLFIRFSWRTVEMQYSFKQLLINHILCYFFDRLLFCVKQLKKNL